MRLVKYPFSRVSEDEVLPEQASACRHCSDRKGEEKPRPRSGVVEQD